MTNVYILVNCLDTYTVYLSEDKANKAREILIEKLIKNIQDCNPIKDPLEYKNYIKDLNKSISIFKTKEGMAFGDGLRVDHETTQDVLL